jgi:predicted PurR-regulated permease PerM
MDGQRNEGSTRAVRIIAAILFVAALYFAADILRPVAVAILLAFLLHPLVVRLVRIGLHRGIAVGITTVIATAITIGVGYLVWTQFVDLSQKVREYEGNLIAKIRDVRQDGNAFGKFRATIRDLQKEMASTQAATEPAAATAAAADGHPPVKVELVNQGPDWVDSVAKYAPPILVPVTQGGIVLLLLIFLLLHSEDVRERIVWFAGMRQISLTTAALDEAGSRIGGYLRMLSVVNLSYGIMISLALWMLGVPSAFLFGAMAAILRFVPFIGPWIAAALPTLVAVAIFQGWRGPIEVIIAFVIIELVTNMLLEPILYGRSTGISSLGVVVAAVFWAWIWGPVGLILAVPLTVVLLVIGKHVPQLSVLNHLFGESTEVPKPVRLYQRLLVGDDLNADKIVEEELNEAKFFEACQTLFMPVLQELKRDLANGLIDMEQARRAMSILDVAASPSHPPLKSTQPPMLFVAAQNEIDDLAATLLMRAAHAEGVPAEMVSSRVLASEVAAHAREEQATMLCLVQVAPISWTHCRHLSKTLSVKLPNATIYAVNIESPEIDAPFEAGTTHLPAKKLYRTVESLMERVRELRFVEPEKQPPAPAPETVGASTC